MLAIVGPAVYFVAVTTAWCLMFRAGRGLK